MKFNLEQPGGKRADIGYNDGFIEFDAELLHI